jgi:hypothetical protein
MQTIILVNILGGYENVNHDRTTMYILLGLVFILQLVVVMLSWFLRETRFIEYTIPLWITLTYFYLNPRESISLSIYLVT